MTNVSEHFSKEAAILCTFADVLGSSIKRGEYDVPQSTQAAIALGQLVVICASMEALKSNEVFMRSFANFLSALLTSGNEGVLQ